jgi:RHS repeat-associated protein
MNEAAQSAGEDGRWFKSVPSVELPKGGGAIRGVGEKFAANSVTGAGAMTVPLAVSPGRSGFGPKLELSYRSGNGNGPFGYGWKLSVPSVTRKTDRGLPQYRDDEESDVFLLDGAEDLVPVAGPDGSIFEDAYTEPGFVIRRYRPRVEGLFARIERWTSVATGESCWRSISRHNVTSWYGKTAESRIADPEDPSRVFTWLLCESYDDKGNAIVYEYAAENEAGVDLQQACERNRARGAGRYLKRVKYGNRVSRLIQPDLSRAEWMFEAVFDYEEGHWEELPLDPALPEDGQHRYVRVSASPGRDWAVRPDPFSTCRAGFEVRTYRRCRRMLMFHRFAELGDGPCLVRATEFEYGDLDDSQPVPVETELAHPGSSRFGSFLCAIIQSGFVRDETRETTGEDGSAYVYLKKSMPPLEFEYSRPVISSDVREWGGEAAPLPLGSGGVPYRWVDLDGEGVPGLLFEHAGAWYYKPNLGEGRFGPQRAVAARPSLADLGGGRQQLLDLAGDGQLDLVSFSGPAPGMYERTEDEGWAPFRPFASLPVIDWEGPNLRFVDLNGDGRADVLVAEQDSITWHPSLAEEGFGPALRVRLPSDEERGPRLVMADGTQSVFFADMNGDGLSDLVRIRNGEVCYWPNMGYGRFGAKVAMDGAPRFDPPDVFDPARIRLADIDGSGVTDILYLGCDGAWLYFNQSGNRFAAPYRLGRCVPTDDAASVATVDLLGNGTVCLVWSSPLPADPRPIRYIDLLDGRKPHLLIRSANNLGAETRIHYTSSTRFYLADKLAGKPWITKIPFPIHVVERVETYDRIGGNRFVTRYAYHHGYFDGREREFQGFGMVEQWDTEEPAAPGGDGTDVSPGANEAEYSRVPPVLTRTWYHTGVWMGRDRISRHYAGLADDRDRGEYYREPGLSDAEASRLLLDDTVLPDGLSAEEEREACRALKGLVLRREVYALDGTAREEHPYTVTEQNFTIRRLQPKLGHRPAVFHTFARESIQYHYERNPEDPRIVHTIVLEADEYGNVRKSASVGYGRRLPDPELDAADRRKQGEQKIVYVENDYTNGVDEADDYRTPLLCESRTYELHGLGLPPGSVRFTFDEMQAAVSVAEPLGYENSPAEGVLAKRLLKRTRTLYRRDDLDGPLALGELQSMALPYESYRCAYTPGLLDDVYAGRVTAAMLEEEGRYVRNGEDGSWWVPSGRQFYSPAAGDSPAQELAYAREHFFLPRRYRDPFHTDAASTETTVRYDDYDLLVLETCDALGNRTTAGERDPDPARPLVRSGLDYRVLQPALVMDPNRNRRAVAFDALGLVAGTAVMGKPEDGPAYGDTLEHFAADPVDGAVASFLQYPLADPHALLAGATIRFVYDLHAYRRTRERENPEPVVVCTLARLTHEADLAPGGRTAVQCGFAYIDGFGRQIQQKLMAEPGPVPLRDPATGRIVTTGGRPQMTETAQPRWLGSGWTVFNNKGKPVRRYEPFFTDTHRFEADARIGVSRVFFYDPVERQIAVLHPDHTWEKTVVDAWRQESWDANDTVLADPASDPDVGEFFRRLPETDDAPTWYARRQSGELGPEEKAAADKAAVHANTPTVAHFDVQGRVFLTVSHNRYRPAGGTAGDSPIEERCADRVVLDIEGQSREVVDGLGRVVMRYKYDMLGNRVRMSSMEAGERWTLNDAGGNRIRLWDSREHAMRIAYDRLRRPIGTYVRESTGPELLVERIVYGESLDDPETGNRRGRTVRLYDQAGVVESDAYDFKGNLIASRRRFAREYKATVDWSAGVPLEPDVYVSRTDYDALDRPTARTAPDGSIVRSVYNERGLLRALEANVGGAPDTVRFVTDIAYNAKGQRERIDYGTIDGSGITTECVFDPDTFRMTQMKTRRNGAGFDATDRPGEVQNLRYTFDPVGNITHVRDDAQQTVFFRNRRIDPTAAYTYDALYRLIEATGREHLGQLGGQPQRFPPDPFDSARTRLDHPGDGDAMGTYTERYVYDAAGNLTEMRHRGSDPSHPGWTRRFLCNEPSLLEPGNTSNRLSAVVTGGDGEPEATEAFGYGGSAGRHGNMTSMPHLSLMLWDYGDRLRATARQTAGSGVTPETTWYVYDAQGRRVRKVTERQAAAGEAPTRKAERIWLDGFETYREYGGDGETVVLERQTLDVSDGNRRIALVDTLVRGDDGGPPKAIRYQLVNSIGSCCLELDDRGAIVSYEEYYPYGGTSYQAVRGRTETKRYRYAGKERDEESGLYDFGARYYACWLGRWINCDPAGLVDGPNLYRFVGGNPITRRDPTGMQQVANDLDPLNPNNYVDFESFSQGYQEALQRSVSPDQLLAIWAAARPAESRPSGSDGSAAIGAGTALRMARTGIQASFAPTSPSGAPLTGPLNLYTGPAARQAAQSAPGYMIRDTVYYAPADAAEAALRARLGVTDPNAFLPPDLYNPIWDEASRLAVRDAVLSGQGVTSHNDIFNIVDLPPGQSLPPGSTALPRGSIQARVELPWLRGLGAGMGGLMMGSGVLTIVGSTQMTQETNNPAPVVLGVVSGSMEATGGLAYVVGAYAADGSMMAAGAAVAETGGLLALPLLMYENIRMSVEIQRALEPQAQRMREEGNEIGAALLTMPIMLY